MVISGLSIEAMTFGAGNICHWFKLVEKNVEEIIFSTAGGSKKKSSHMRNHYCQSR